jgi:hypothetical protein
MSGFLAPTVLTAQDKLANRRRDKQQQAQALWQQIDFVFRDLGNWIWSNPLGFDPQTVLNQYGKNAGELFAFANATAALVESLTGSAPAPFVPADWSAKANADGTVTVKKSA